ncbi:MAG: sodium:proton antiporter [Candidatus Gracilibacteria bacterium]|nr:sodium:proton antiporter [Candidatus Gracilibacteria bacterium]
MSTEIIPTGDVSFMTQTLSVLFLLFVSSFAYLFSKKINFPYTVLLVVIGLLLVPLSKVGLFSFIDDFQLTPDILFFVFLPVLLFESAYNINYRHIIKSWKTITSLAVFGLIISAFLIAGGLYVLFPAVGLDVPFIITLLFGVLISATDPVAVLSIFKTIGAPRKLALIFEGESLFNDGTAVAIFLVILGVILEGGIITDSTYLVGAWKFISMLFGGIIFGVITGVVFSKIIEKIKNNEEVEIVLTMLLAHLTFIIAELITHHFTFLPISGVIATVVASIIIGNYGRYKITPRVECHMQKFWEFFAFVSNSIVFILLGLILSTIDEEVMNLVPIMLISIPIVMTARALSVYIPIGFVNFFRLEEERIPASWQHLLSWGSLRGALALMMVLMIPGEGHAQFENILRFEEAVGWTDAYHIKDFLLILTITNIMFTLFVKAPTIAVMMRKMGVDKLHELESFEHEEGKILANFKILEKLSNSYKKAYLTKYEYDELLSTYTQKLNNAVSQMKILLKDNAENAETLIRRAISLHALGIEKQYLKDLFFYNEIDERNFKYILRKIEKQMERVENESPQLRKFSNETMGYDFFSRLALGKFRRESTDVDAYIRNRARVIITRKVIKELKSLSSIEFGFNNNIFEEVITLYASFNKVADEKRIKIMMSHKATINAVESKLVNKSLLRLEEKVIKDMYNKEIITPKLYIKFMEEVETQMFQDVKSMK